MANQPRDRTKSMYDTYVAARSLKAFLLAAGHTNRSTRLPHNWHRAYCGAVSQPAKGVAMALLLSGAEHGWLADAVLLAVLAAGEQQEARRRGMTCCA